MKRDFRKRLKEGPILCDGAMGTLLDLYEYPDLPHEIQNVNNPEIVERIHREYILAGAEIIQTNTFSGNRLRLSQFHLEDRLKEINKAGVEIARRAAGKEVFVGGSVGPTGKLLEPLGKISLAKARDASGPVDSRDAETIARGAGELQIVVRSIMDGINASNFAPFPAESPSAQFSTCARCDVGPACGSTLDLERRCSHYAASESTEHLGAIRIERESRRG